mmetsp:Transcript_4144/g.4805  ORF Transcript_4144/g.4805 Transcript_4144/m.4805 type:complete len:241 (-) Transcript_4144:147-869(-)
MQLIAKKKSSLFDSRIKGTLSRKGISTGNGLKKIAEILSSWQTPFKFVHHDESPESESEVFSGISNPDFKPAMAKKESDEAVVEEVRKIIDSITDSIMQKIVEEKNFDDAFDRNKLPSMSLNNYLFRLVKYLDRWYKEEASVKSVGMRSLFLALIYIDHVQKMIPDFRLNEYNVHRLFLISMLIGAKFTEDKPISNKYWAQVGGIDMQQVNSLESAFCSISEFNLYVCDEELHEVIDQFC